MNNKATLGEVLYRIALVVIPVAMALGIFGILTLVGTIVSWSRPDQWEEGAFYFIRAASLMFFIAGVVLSVQLHKGIVAREKQDEQ